MSAQSPKPIQLLFHMATGSGKTLIMAGAILNLYKKGYRNFIFLVNSLDIIEKTKVNFLQANSSKYLFTENIYIDNQHVNIKSVSNFERVNSIDINIVFTTIQGLHTKLNTPRENALNYLDFESEKIVLLSDEAHHINALTKKGKQTKAIQEEIKSWEGTVNKIFKTNQKNILLEFTATADLSHPEINKKYRDKILFDYSLKQFRKDKYSKEVQVIQADLSPFNRALQAVLMSQYRKEIFAQNKLEIKPVILFKSKRIIESKNFFNDFIEGIKNLTAKQLIALKNLSNQSVLNTAVDYFIDKEGGLEHLILVLREDFSTQKCIAIDSKNDSEQKQLIINSLEDKSNPYRAVFAVDKLNEGWDVLNLFDIVRLYELKDSNSKKTTISEAQLIGRGARYCPFTVDKTQFLYRRKYDDDLKNDLRVCEELYYYTANHPPYIAALNKALVHVGIKASKTEKRRKTQDKTPEVLQIQDDSFSETILENIFKISLSTDTTNVKLFRLGDFKRTIIQKAIHKSPFYKFDNLTKQGLRLSSMSQFMSSDKYLNALKIAIKGTPEQIINLSDTAKLEIVLEVLAKISAHF